MQAIKTEGLSKQYILGGAEPLQQSMRDMITDVFKAPLRRYRTLSGVSDEERKIWALKDLDLEVNAGEVVGVIGKNGSGKSTLLKLLSRITEPTKGRAIIHGRVSSLLEVGTGFHPELTGRENTFLNAAILGMTRAEITKKFDEIVTFAEIERFIDTPVKRYSSGMSIRLAFSIAAHLDPEVLLIDEVLAVGDIAFQEKCLGHLRKAETSGRTVLFVSHQLHSVQQLCSRAVVLEKGQLVYDGNVGAAVTKYLDRVKDKSSAEWFASENGAQGEFGSIEFVRVLNKDGLVYSEFSRDEDIYIEFGLGIRKTDPELVLSCDILRQGLVVMRTSDFDVVAQSGKLDYLPGKYVLRVRIPSYFLNFGEYQVEPRFGPFDFLGQISSKEMSVMFRVRKEAAANEYVSRLWESTHPGSTYPKLEWSIDRTK